MAILTTIKRHLLDFCYPGVCAVCGGEGSDGASPTCDVCHTKLEQLESAAACEGCARPIAHEGGPCPWCLGKGIYPYERIARLGLFVDPLKHLIHQMKYHRRWPLAEHLAERLCVKASAREILANADVIVPVPLHRWRQIARGYNQSEVIAKWLAHRAKKKIVRPVVRLRATETQTHLHSREKRVENLRDAFGLVDGRRLKDKNVVVVDDVMTTGATLQSIGRVLLDGEPRSLSAVVLAIADPKHRDFQSI